MCDMHTRDMHTRARAVLRAALCAALDGSAVLLGVVCEVLLLCWMCGVVRCCCVTCYVWCTLATHTSPTLVLNWS